MIKVEVIEGFTLQDFDKLKNIQRKDKEQKGRLFIGDVFECTQEMTNYLLGENRLQRAFVKIIEVKPEEDEKKQTKTEKPVKEKKTTTKKATTSKKTIANK